MGTSNDPDCRRSDVAALFNCHEVEIGRFLHQFVGDRELASDLLQETFLAVMASNRPLETIENHRAWLYGIARRKALQSMRSWRRMLRAGDRLRSGSDRSPPEPLDILYVRDLLTRTLTPLDRSLVLLTELHGFTSEELAAATELNAAAIRKRLSRAKQRLLEADLSSPPGPLPSSLEPKESP